MKLFQAKNQDGQLILNEAVTGQEIGKRIYWANNSKPFYLSKKDGILIPVNMIKVTNVFREEKRDNGNKTDD